MLVDRITRGLEDLRRDVADQPTYSALRPELAAFSKNELRVLLCLQGIGSSGIAFNGFQQLCAVDYWDVPSLVEALNESGWKRAGYYGRNSYGWPKERLLELFWVEDAGNAGPVWSRIRLTDLGRTIASFLEQHIYMGVVVEDYYRGG